LKIKFQNIIFPEGTVYFNGTLKKDKITTIFKVLKPETIKESTLVALIKDNWNSLLNDLFLINNLQHA